MHTPIKPLTPKEIAKEIKLLNPKKSPGSDLVTAKMLKELPRKGIVMLTYIFNAIIRLGYWPKRLKTAQIIMINKPGKEPTEVSSYRPISLLSIVSKLLEKLVLHRLNEDLPPENWIPEHQFGFRQKHSTVQQVHRITHTINEAFEKKQYCSGIFLDISQAFDKVWYPGLIYKIKCILPTAYFTILKSYLSERKFQTKVNEEKSDYFPINSGVPQGSVLGPLLYVLYTSDIPMAQNLIIGTFADDTAILSCHENPQIASNKIQNYLTNLQQWLEKWKIKVNESKSAHITFTLRKETCPAVTINNVQIPQTQTVRYLGLHLDSKLTWKQHITKKKKQVEIKTRELQWLIGRKSRVSLENKILIYKAVIKPTWEYGIELWGCASKSNIQIIQRCQSKILRQIADAPWYVTNHTIHTDLQVPIVQEVIGKKANTHHIVINNHPNLIIEQLTEPVINKRLKKRWPSELI
uniref:Reverse transcriptase domain-containing protein n=2 Tax=Photinus pyralis TaxID=7054 RepID=A0A1Y1JXT3_PHOPY